MIVLTHEKLKACLPAATLPNIQKYLKPLNDTLFKYSINSVPRVSYFLAQVAHESGSLRYVEEIASGEAYDTGRLAKNLGNTPEKDGDGQRYKGRGLIQITGLYNYILLSKALGFDFVKYPEKLTLPGAAALSAGWFWNVNKLNTWADLNTDESFRKATKIINGGYNGLDDRIRHLNIIRPILMKAA